MATTITAITIIWKKLFSKEELKKKVRTQSKDA
jgi:hypothetical protein